MSQKLSTAIAVFSDLVLVNLAVALAALIRFGGDIPWQKFKSYLLLSPFITIISPIAFYIFELYDRKACNSRPRIVLNVFRGGLVIFITSVLSIRLCFPNDALRNYSHASVRAVCGLDDNSHSWLANHTMAYSSTVNWRL